MKSGVVQRRKRKKAGKMHKVTHTSLARKDIEDIWIYSFNNWGEDQADKYFYEMDKAINTISENPNLGAACDYVRNGYRQYHVNSHVIFYHINGSEIEIVRVLHDSMNFNKHL